MMKPPSPVRAPQHFLPDEQSKSDSQPTETDPVPHGFAEHVYVGAPPAAPAL